MLFLYACLWRLCRCTYHTEQLNVVLRRGFMPGCVAHSIFRPDPCVRRGCGRYVYSCSGPGGYGSEVPAPFGAFVEIGYRFCRRRVDYLLLGTSTRTVVYPPDRRADVGIQVTRRTYHHGREVKTHNVRRPDVHNTAPIGLSTNSGRAWPVLIGNHHCGNHAACHHRSPPSLSPTRVHLFFDLVASSQNTIVLQPRGTFSELRLISSLLGVMGSLYICRPKGTDSRSAPLYALRCSFRGSLR
jgi:hypothetical protein